MKLSNQLVVDYRSVSIVQLPITGGLNSVEMILPGASTSTIGSCSCSCGAMSKVD